MNKKLLIITGPQGSGNHLFSRILSTHPEVGGWKSLLEADNFWTNYLASRRGINLQERRIFAIDLDRPRKLPSRSQPRGDSDRRRPPDPVQQRRGHQQ